jgi:hypothetical protein
MEEGRKAGQWRLIGAWTWTVIALFSVVGSLTDGLILAAVLLAASTLLTAPFLAEQRARYLSPKASLWAAVVTGVMGMALIGAAQPSKPTPAPPAPQGATAAAAASPTPAPTPVASATAKAEFRALYDQLLSIANGCDDSSAKATEAVQQVAKGRSNRYQAYAIATDAKRACADAGQSLGELTVPASLPADQQAKMREGLGQCREAYGFRESALSTMLTVLDGDERPSQVQAFKDQAQTAQLGVLQCVAVFLTVGQTIGVDLMPREKK